MKVDLEQTKVGGFHFEFLRAVSYEATNGSELGEAFSTIQKVHEGDFESWTAAWASLAERVADQAEEFLKENQRASALSAFLRASNYYRAAEFYASYENPMQYDSWKKSRDCFQKAARLTSPPIEVLDIPFGKAHLPGYFVSGGEGRRPTLLAMSGFDGSGEELYHMIGRASADRGWHCLIFEGPGQRGALHINPGLTFRPDYEAPVGAVVDYAVSRPDVDRERLALIGYSFGGNLAPRAAAFDSRIRACIADSLVVDVGEAWRAAWPAALRDAPDRVFDAMFATLAHANPDTRWGLEHARWAMGIEHPHEMFEAFAPYSLLGLEDKLTCPLLCLFGEDEIAQTSRKIIEETTKFMVALRCPRDVRLFMREEGAASHCQFGGLALAQAAIFGWLGKILGDGGSEKGQGGRFVIPQEFVDVVERYHGKDFGRNVLQQDA